MKNWELFEEEACEYLNDVFNGSNVHFRNTGGKNSHASDIEIWKHNRCVSSLEAKLSPSQSGQFVLEDYSGVYSLSALTIFENTESTQYIIDYLNANRSRFEPNKQEHIGIDIHKSVLTKWVQEHYSRKNSHFIITSHKLQDYKAIIPIDKIGDYFNVSAVIRRKRSGTRHLAKYKVEESLQMLSEHLQKHDDKILAIFNEGSKTLVEINSDNLPDSARYFGEEYFLSRTSSGKYYIKQRSNSNNLNVIFSLEYIGPHRNIGAEILEAYIENVL